MTIVSSPLQKKIQSNFELIFENTDGKWSLRIIQKNVVAVPEWPRCPSGYKYDANGKCRWFLKNRKK